MFEFVLAQREVSNGFECCGGYPVVPVEVFQQSTRASRRYAENFRNLRCAKVLSSNFVLISPFCETDNFEMTTPYESVKLHYLVVPYGQKKDFCTVSRDVDSF